MIICYKILKPFVYLQHETKDHNIWQIFWRVYGGADCQRKREGRLWPGIAEDSRQVADKVRQTYQGRTI